MLLRLELEPKLEPLVLPAVEPVVRLRLEELPKLLVLLPPEPTGRLLVVVPKLLPLTLESELRD